VSEAMKTAYVWIFDWWKTEPIYHRPLPRHPMWTFCGRKVGDVMKPIPSAHAAKVGKPCKQCYPGGRRVH
jgi:hypothetical protein